MQTQVGEEDKKKKDEEEDVNMGGIDDISTLVCQITFY